MTSQDASSRARHGTVEALAEALHAMLGAMEHSDAEFIFEVERAEAEEALFRYRREVPPAPPPAPCSLGLEPHDFAVQSAQYMGAWWQCWQCGRHMRDLPEGVTPEQANFMDMTEEAAAAWRETRLPPAAD